LHSNVVAATFPTRFDISGDRIGAACPSGEEPGGDDAG
jgi:hypothetical protein